MRWARDVTEFTVDLTRNKQSDARYRYIPKPVLKILDRPERPRFVIQNGQVMVEVIGHE